ncbi:hypothetical protein HAX54_031698 [Datura stramonium]|uniref:Uncharacterized protein n=1 Tax=Datura stramonium TaxID=4076 RepID=A0ABS8VBW6_DATST|nr:hypothetical protein [Datura stramonium]
MSSVPPVNSKSCLVKHRQKCKSRRKATSHNKELAFHRCFAGQDRPLDIIVRDDGVITLGTKIDNSLPSSMFSSIALGSPQADRVNSSLPTGLLTMAQMARAHNSQLLKLAKTIPPIIKKAIKKAMQPIVEKLGCLHAKVEVLEKEVTTLGGEVVRRKEILSPTNIDMNELLTATTQPEESRNPPDDWCVGYDSPLEILFDEDIYHSHPPPHQILSRSEIDPL